MTKPGNGVRQNPIRRSAGSRHSIYICASRNQKAHHVGLILAHGQTWPFYWIGQIALWVVVVTALVSGADYFRRFNEVVARPS